MVEYSERDQWKIAYNYVRNPNYPSTYLPSNIREKIKVLQSEGLESWETISKRITAQEKGEVIKEDIYQPQFQIVGIGEGSTKRPAALTSYKAGDVLTKQQYQEIEEYKEQKRKAAYSETVISKPSPQTNIISQQKEEDYPYKLTDKYYMEDNVLKKKGVSVFELGQVIERKKEQPIRTTPTVEYESSADTIGRVVYDTTRKAKEKTEKVVSDIGGTLKLVLGEAPSKGTKTLGEYIGVAITNLYEETTGKQWTGTEVTIDSIYGSQIIPTKKKGEFILLETPVEAKQTVTRPIITPSNSFTEFIKPSKGSTGYQINDIITRTSKGEGFNVMDLQTTPKNPNMISQNILGTPTRKRVGTKEEFVEGMGGTFEMFTYPLLMTTGAAGATVLVGGGIGKVIAGETLGERIGGAVDIGFGIYAFRQGKKFYDTKMEQQQQEIIKLDIDKRLRSLKRQEYDTSKGAFGWSNTGGKDLQVIKIGKSGRTEYGSLSKELTTGNRLIGKETYKTALSLKDSGVVIVNEQIGYVAVAGQESVVTSASRQLSSTGRFSTYQALSKEQPIMKVALIEYIKPQSSSFIQFGRTTGNVGTQAVMSGKEFSTGSLQKVIGIEEVGTKALSSSRISNTRVGVLQLNKDISIFGVSKPQLKYPQPKIELGGIVAGSGDKTQTVWDLGKFTFDSGSKGLATIPKTQQVIKPVTTPTKDISSLQKLFSSIETTTPTSGRVVILPRLDNKETGTKISNVNELTISDITPQVYSETKQDITPTTTLTTESLIGSVQKKEGESKNVGGNKIGYGNLFVLNEQYNFNLDNKEQQKTSTGSGIISLQVSGQAQQMKYKKQQVIVPTQPKFDFGKVDFSFTPGRLEPPIPKIELPWYRNKVIRQQQKTRTKKTKSTTSYTPTLSGIFGGYTTTKIPKQKSFLGFEIRPVVVGRKKK